MKQDSLRSFPLVPILVLMTIAIAAGGIGFAAWRSREKATRDVTLETYLKLKADGAIQEAWLDGDGITPRIDPKAVAGFLDPEELRYVRTRVPLVFLADPNLFRELKGGLAPGKFHHAGGREGP